MLPAVPRWAVVAAFSRYSSTVWDGARGVEMPRKGVARPQSISVADALQLRPGDPLGIQQLDDLRRFSCLMREGLEERPTAILRLMDEALLGFVQPSLKKLKETCDGPHPTRPGHWAKPGVSAGGFRVTLAANVFKWMKEERLPLKAMDFGLIFVAAVAAYDEPRTAAPSDGRVGGLRAMFVGRALGGLPRERQTPLGYLDDLLRGRSFSSAARKFGQDVIDGVLDLKADERNFLARMRDALPNRRPSRAPGKQKDPNWTIRSDGHTMVCKRRNCLSVRTWPQRTNALKGLPNTQPVAERQLRRYAVAARKAGRKDLATPMYPCAVRGLCLFVRGHQEPDTPKSV